MSLKGTGDVYRRLGRQKLKEAADAMKVQIIGRMKAEGMDKSEYQLAAHNEMWEVFEPAVVALEKRTEDARKALESANQATKEAVAAASEATFTPYQGDVDDVIDPDYSQDDPSKVVHDSIFWAAMEFRRVVIDSPRNTVVDVSKAKKKPPTPYAVSVVEFYAEHRDKRQALMDKVVVMTAKKTPTPKPKASDPGKASEGDDYFSNV